MNTKNKTTTQLQWREGDDGLGTPLSEVEGAVVVANPDKLETKETNRPRGDDSTREHGKVECPLEETAEPTSSDDEQPVPQLEPEPFEPEKHDAEAGRVDSPGSRPRTTTQTELEGREGDDGLGTPLSEVVRPSVAPRPDDREIEETKGSDGDESSQENHSLQNPAGPAAGPRSPDDERSPRPSKQERQQNESQEHGREDSGVFSPTSPTEGAEPLTDAEEKAMRRQDDEELQRRLERVPRRSTFPLPSGIGRALAWSGLALAGVLGLFLVTQAVSVVSDILALPSPFNWIAGLLALVLGLMLAWMLLRFSLKVVRFRRNPSVNLRAIQALNDRSHIQDMAAAHAEQAVRELRTYLEEYQLDSEDRRRLVTLGLTHSETEDLRAARRSLLANDDPRPSDEWLSDFHGQFQSILDRSAKKCVLRYAGRAWLGTAAGPGALIDQAVVVYAYVALVRDLTFIYRLRPAFGQTATILALSMTQVYLAGLTEDAAEAAADTFLGELAATGLGALAAAIGAKIAEGAMHGLFMWRLGRRAVSLLQPVQPPK